MAEYIEREAAIKAVCDSSAHTCYLNNCLHGCQEAQAILAIPAADVVPVRHGRWARIDYEPLGHDYICSECGGKNERASRYCPDCGTRMDRERGDNP